MTDQEILDLAHRTATVYRHRSDPNFPSYGFLNHTIIDFARRIEKAALERAAEVCEAIENERWALYKGRPPYTGTEQGRADNYVQGESGGACLCAEAIRALKDDDE